MSDLIRREDAIKAIHNYWKKRLDTLPTKESEYGEVYADIQQMDKILCNFINAIPSADRPQEWIPCSERVPKWREHIDDMVLVCYADGSVRFNTFMNWRWVQGEPIAWMPLPEPWKGADDE